MIKKPEVTLDGDKETYTMQEVARLLNELGANVFMTKADGEVTPVVIED